MIPGISCPKPERRTPEQRRAEKQQRTHNTLKPARVDKPKPQGLTQGKAKPERDPHCFKSYRPEKPKTGLQRRKGLGASTGTRTLQKRLQRLLVNRQGHKIQTVTHRPGFTLKKGQGLKPIGPRGRRLAPGDRKQAALAHQLPCCCGCCLPVEWAHLESRRYEETRHVAHLSIPACHYLHHWIDQGKGTAVRPLLLELAKTKGERLTHEDIYQTISDAGYYTWLQTTTRI